jgi:hypothetical protein
LALLQSQIAVAPWCALNSSSKQLNTAAGKYFFRSHEG